MMRISGRLREIFTVCSSMIVASILTVVRCMTYSATPENWASRHEIWVNGAMGFAMLTCFFLIGQRCLKKCSDLVNSYAHNRVKPLSPGPSNGLTESGNPPFRCLIPEQKDSVLSNASGCGLFLP